MSRPVLFRILAIGFGFGLLLLAEGVLWLLPHNEPDPFVDLASFTLFSHVEQDGVEVIQITHPYAYPERAVRFTAEKAAGTRRVFVLGASAAAGWPHPPEETFTAYLQHSLQDPGGPTIEIVNASAHGFPSYRVRRIFDEVLKFSPDAIVVYCGNNEFLEARSYELETISRLSRILSRSQIVRRGRRLLPSSRRLAGDELNELAATMWAKVQRQATALRSDPEQFAGVQKHYAASLGYMAATAAERNIPLLLVTVPSNLRDWLPTVSVEVPPDATDQWRRHFDGGRAALHHADWRAAAESLTLATETLPHHAESWFWLGRALEGLGATDEARTAYRRAKDEDLNPFRALSSFNETVRRSAHDGDAELVDLEATFDEMARGAAPGFDLFLDYVHPTLDGNRLIALTIGAALAPRLGLDIPGAEQLPTSGYRESDDFSLGMKSLGMALINHQYVAAVARSQQIVALVQEPPPAATQPIPNEVPPVVREALAVLTPFLELEYRRRLGPPPSEVDLARVEQARREFYDRWFQYGSF